MMFDFCSLCNLYPILFTVKNQFIDATVIINFIPAEVQSSWELNLYLLVSGGKKVPVLKEIWTSISISGT